MYFEIGVDEHFFENLESQIKKGGSFSFNPSNEVEVDLYCNASSPITFNMVNKLAERLRADDFKKHKPILTITGKEFLSSSKVIALLSNEYLVSLMTNYVFTQLISSSDVATKFALRQVYTRKKLNNWLPGSDRQTFDSSCAARVLMKILKEQNIIKPSEYSRCTELDIYNQIWIGPQRQACPQKIIEFIKKIKRGAVHHFNVHSIEIADITDHLIEHIDSVIDGTIQHSHLYPALAQEMKRSYLLFKFAQTDSFEKISIADTKMRQLGKQEYLLLVERSSGGSHTCLGKKNQQGKFSVYDPAYGRTSIYDSFSDYIQLKQNSYAGVCLNIRARL